MRKRQHFYKEGRKNLILKSVLYPAHFGQRVFLPFYEKTTFEPSTYHHQKKEYLNKLISVVWIAVLVLANIRL